MSIMNSVPSCIKLIQGHASKIVSPIFTRDGFWDVWSPYYNWGSKPPPKKIQIHSLDLCTYFPIGPKAQFHLTKCTCVLFEAS